MVALSMFDPLPVIRDATFSPCGRYRYTLRRQWDESKPSALFVMLNPSTATALLDDPTIRRCIGFAKAWGYGGLLVGNIFAMRSTDPDVLYDADDPVGPDNDAALAGLHSEAALTVAAWGVHGKYLGRGNAVLRRLGGAVRCLGQTKDGHPRHPLYIAGDCMPVEYGDARG